MVQRRFGSQQKPLGGKERNVEENPAIQRYWHQPSTREDEANGVIDW